MYDPHQFLETLALVLCAAALTSLVFQRLGQPVVLGYLLAGMLLGPYIPIPLVADRAIVQTLSELGVILLMFSLGVEFSLKKLLRVAPTAGLIAIVQCSVMIWLGYLVGQAFGWTRLESIFAGAVIAISSTTITVKAFQEQRIKGDFTELVFGELLVEDLIAVLLLTLLTTLATHAGITSLDVGRTVGRLSAFLALLVVGGLFIVPRLMRVVVGFKRSEITLVASIGLAFGFAWLAASFGYSVALGAFIAGGLVAESGVERSVAHLVEPVRDLFAAIFFVSVGMLIDPAPVADQWSAAIVLLLVVVVGKIVAVTAAAFLTGQSISTSVKTGMSLAHIGEFSFIIAGVGAATGATGKFLYPLAVAVSAVTTLLSPWLIRAAAPVASFVDRKLPRPLQTFAALYGSWWEPLRANRRTTGGSGRVGGLVRWLAVDAVMVAAIIIGASVEMEGLVALAEDHVDLAPGVAVYLVVLGATLAAMPFVIGIVRVARVLGFELAARTFPQVAAGALDTASAPRRLFIISLQLAIVTLVGAPLLAVTQPFLPPLPGAIGFGSLLALLAISFWQRAADLQGHARAAAQVIAEVLAHQTQPADTSRDNTLDDVQHLLSGLGSPLAIKISDTSPAVGKTLAELNLRGVTGATVLAVRRGEEIVLVPAGNERLQAGDALAIAGSQESIDAARAALGAPDPLPVA